MDSKPEPIHRWDGPLMLKALLYGAALAAIAAAPAVLSRWGHAGPESLWGWLGLLLNVPGLLVMWLLITLTGSRESDSVVNTLVGVYLIQALIFGYLTFVWLRRKKRRAGVA